MGTRTTVSPGEVAAAYQMAFTTQEGQIVLHDLLRRFGYTRRSMFQPGATRPEDLAFAEGGRSVLTHVGLMLDVDPDDYEKSMSQEGQHDAQ